MEPRPPLDRQPFFRRTFVALTHRDFRSLMIGNGISNVGSWMQLVAQPWLVLTLTQSSFLVGLDGFMGHLPSFLFLIPGGIYADRHSRKNIMIASQVVQLVCAALTALLLATGQIQVWMIIAFSFIVGTAQAFSFPAYQALVTTLVPREHLGNAISLNSMQFNLSRIIGPLLAGAAMASVGAAWCFGLNSLSFLALIVAVWGMSSPFAGAAPRDPAKPREPASVGLKLILGDRRILGVLLLVFASMAFSGPLSTFLPVIVKQVFGGGATEFSWSVAIFGGGALTGAFIAAAGSSRLGIGLSVCSCLGLGVLVLVMSVTPTLWLADAVLFCAGVLMITSSAAANTFLQSTLGSEFRGRVASFFLLAIRGGLALGNLSTGWVSELYGSRSAMAANGVLALVCTVAIWAAFLRRDVVSSGASFA